MRSRKLVGRELGSWMSAEELCSGSSMSAIKGEECAMYVTSPAALVRSVTVR